MPQSEPRARPRRRIRRRHIVVAALAVVVLIAPALVTTLQCALRTGMTEPAVIDPPAVRQAKSAVADYARAGSATFFTLPEWLIVYHTEEYGAFLAHERPSAFPYFGAIGQYWGYYRRMCDAACGSFPFDAREHVMLAVIGTSFSAENLLKGIYENSIGRATEWIATNDSDEDRFAARTATGYGRFMHTIPWYDFPFGRTFVALWSETPLWGRHPLRKWERKLALSLEYGVKAAYGSLIRAGTKASYGDEAEWVHLWAEHVPERVFDDARLKQVASLGNGSYVLSVKRYEPFTAAVAQLASQGVRFRDIAGNPRILVTAIADDGVPALDPAQGRVLFSTPLLTSSRERFAIDARVDALGDILNRLGQSGVTIEHIYDY